MNPKGQRDMVFSAGALSAIAFFDFTTLYSGYQYSSQSGWMILREF